jgi:hypothetical protein
MGAKPSESDGQSTRNEIASGRQATDSLSISDYLEAATDASKRARFVTIAIVVASVLVLVSVLNSWDYGWMSLRHDAFQHRTDYALKKFPLLCRCKGEIDAQNKEYVCGQLKSDPRIVLYDNLDDGKHTLQLDNLCKEETTELHSFISALDGSAANTMYTVHVPFFGVVFDINDVGILAGIGLLVLLVLLRLALRSQIVSMRIGFRAAFDRHKEDVFYHVLAARQVFIFPRLRDPEQQVVRMRGWIEAFWQSLKITDQPKDEWQASRNTMLRLVPQLLSLLPAIIYSLEFWNDFHSRTFGYDLSRPRTDAQLVFEAFLMFLILVFGVWCITKWNELDKLWDYYDELIQENRKPMKTVGNQF